MAQEFNLPEKISKTEAHMIMNSKVHFVQEGISIKATIELLLKCQISGVPVVDVNNKLIGIISEQDLLIQSATKDLKSPIEFTRQVAYVHPTTPLSEILKILYTKRYKRLPVINQNKTIVGIISRIDVLKKILH
ncbi:MAG: CBS domain-containing protein [Pseudomonadota bacterium]